MRPRSILHVDLDAFYASVEQLDDPSLRGRPVIVGGAPPRGVVAAASYEVRRFGVRSAMPTLQALERCPHAVLIHPRIARYSEVSHGFFEILRSYTPLVEGLSLDEAFLDVTGTERLFGEPPAVAQAIKGRVREELGIVASVGVASCKFVAKVASDLSKPDGLLVVAEADVVAFLAPLSVGRLWGVGEVLEGELLAMGVRTVGDLVKVGAANLTPRLGRERAEHLLSLAVGDDARAVEPEREAVSIGSEDTFEHDLRDRSALVPHLLAQADEACARLRREGLRARTVTIKVKYGNHQLVTRRTTLERATSDAHLVGEVACRLCAAVPFIEQRGVRLTGVSLSGLGEKGHESQLFLDEKQVERGEELGATMDRIRDKFGGAAALRRAVHVESPKGSKPGPKPGSDGD